MQSSKETTHWQQNRSKNDLKSQNKDFKTNNKGKKMYAGIDPYIPPQAKDDYQKLRTHAKKQKNRKTSQ